MVVRFSVCGHALRASSQSQTERSQVRRKQLCRDVSSAVVVAAVCG